MKNRSFTLTAEIETPASGGDGVIVTQRGGRTGGWVVFLEGGKLGFHYNFCGLERTTVLAPAAARPGSHKIAMPRPAASSTARSSGPNLNLPDDDHSHHINPEEHLAAAMKHQ